VYACLIDRLIRFSWKNFFLLFLIFFASCNWFKSSSPDDAVAKVYDKYLYKSDLIGIVPKGSTARDSIAIIKNYINNWIQQELLLHRANDNLSNQQKNFDKQLEEYKNSLIIYAYEKELVKQKLDTNVTDAEISKYYDTHKGDFELKDNIIKVTYVKLPLKSPGINQIKRLYKSDNPQDKDALEKLCLREAANFFLEDAWLLFNDMLKEIPIKTYNQEDFLKTHENVEMEDSTYHYFVHFKAFQIKESLSPISFEKENIHSIILNKRKLKLIEDMQDETFKDAVKHSNFTIY